MGLQVTGNQTPKGDVLSFLLLTFPAKGCQTENSKHYPWPLTGQRTRKVIIVGIPSTDLEPMAIELCLHTRRDGDLTTYQGYPPGLGDLDRCLVPFARSGTEDSGSS